MPDHTSDPEHRSLKILPPDIVKKQLRHVTADQRTILRNCCLIPGEAAAFDDIESHAAGVAQRQPPLRGEPVGDFRVGEMFQDFDPRAG